jgi:hypothetical protein
VDLIDCVTGGKFLVIRYVPVARLLVSLNRCIPFQAPFAAEPKEFFPNLPVGTVGAITEPQQAEVHLQGGNRRHNCGEVVSEGRGPL